MCYSVKKLKEAVVNKSYNMQTLYENKKTVHNMYTLGFISRKVLYEFINDTYGWWMDERFLYDKDCNIVYDYWSDEDYKA